MNETLIGTIVVACFIGVLVFAILDSISKSIKESMYAKDPPSKILEHQKVTYDGKVIVSCYFVPYLRGESVRWKKIHIKRLKYTTPEYTIPFSKSTKCASFDIASNIIKNHKTIRYHGVKLYPILVYDKSKSKEDVVYYCKKYHYPFNKQHLILGPLEDCKNLVDDIGQLGANTKHVVFTHLPSQQK